MSYGKFIVYMLLLSLLLSEPLLSTARADVLVRSALPSERDVILSVYQKFPGCCRTSAHVIVQFLNNKTMNDFLNAGLDPGSPDRNSEDSIDGVYQDETRQITLRAPDSLNQLAMTFAHEYGHYLWFNALTPAQRHEYERLYNQQRMAHHLITPYAACCLEEGFAEAFSFYVLQADKLANIDAQSSAYFTRYLKDSPLKPAAQIYTASLHK